MESLGMDAEYHLIDLAYGVSHGGFRSGSRTQYAREEHWRCQNDTLGCPLHQYVWTNWHRRRGR
jgi:hypothetical protein